LATLGLEAADASGEGAIGLACHTVLGLIAKDEGDYGRARRHLEQSGAMAKALGREGDEMVAKMNLGSVAFDAGDHSAAVPLWIDVLDYHRARGTLREKGSPSSISASRRTVSARRMMPGRASPKPRLYSTELGFASISHTRCREWPPQRRRTTATERPRGSSAEPPRCWTKPDPEPAPSTPTWRGR